MQKLTGLKDLSAALPSVKADPKEGTAADAREDAKPKRPAPAHLTKYQFKPGHGAQRKS